MKLPNYSIHNNKIRVRVMCPVCDIGGAHFLFMSAPKCHICDYEVEMMPASNNHITCTWKFAKQGLLN